MQRYRSIGLWTAVFGIALGIRLIGIGWGLPNAERYYSYHPDEWLILLASYFTINPYAGEFLPGFYNYGTLPMYLWSVWLHWLSAAGVIGGLPENPSPAQVAELRAQLYLWGRILVALMGAGTAVVVGRTLAIVAGVQAGIIAGLAIALAPALVVHSDFMTVDVPTTFFVSLAFHQAVALTISPRPLRTLLWGAVWAGCAAGSKYNAGLALLAPLVSLWLANSPPLGRRILGSLAATGVAGLTFALVCPGIWADSERFWSHFWYEVRHVGQGHGEIFTDTGLGWLYHINPNLSTGFGAIGLVASLIGWAFYGRRYPALWGILTASLAYYLLIGAAEVRFLRYTFPLFPMLAVGVGLLWTASPPSPLSHGAGSKTPSPPSPLSHGAGSKTPSPPSPLSHAVGEGESGSPRPRRGRRVGGEGFLRILALASLLWQLLSATSLALCMRRPDARDQAAQWVWASLPSGTRIGFPTVPWFYTPPLFPETGELRWQDRLRYAQNAQPYRLLPLAPPEWNAEALRATLPEYLIISEFEERDVQRIGRADYQAFMRIVSERYTLERTFRNEPPLLGRKESVPHDLLYICPQVKVYRLR